MKKTYIDRVSGTVYEEIPDTMTSLSGNQIISKTHPRIQLRGALDTLHALLLLCRKEGEALPEALADVEELLHWVRMLQSYEVTETPPPAFLFSGLSLEQVWEHIHHPEKYYDTQHLFEIGVTSPPLLLWLNFFRTQVRAAETTALIAANTAEDGVSRDLARSLNYMSSGVYLLELRITSGFYNKGERL